MFETEIARGVTLLNSKYPDWYQRIDLNRLDINSCYLCILGQLYRDFLNGLDSINLFNDMIKDTPSISYGFEAPRGEGKQLTTEWKTTIQRLLDDDAQRLNETDR